MQELQGSDIYCTSQNRHAKNSHLQYVKDVEFVANSHTRLLRHCISEIDSEDEVEDGEASDDGYEKLHRFSY